jgi:DNA-binding CsgD family transcriptional regulator
VVAAARLGELASITQHLEDADRLLDRLGNPSLWAVPMHWCRLHAAILSDASAEAERYAAALAADTASSPYATALAGAAQSWLQVLSGRIDRESTEAASRHLHRIGLAWEGARLAGQAALRASDRRAVASLHACARALLGDAPAAESAPAPGEPPAARRTAEAPTESAGRADSDVAPPAVPTPRRAEEDRPGGGSAEHERLVLSERELEVSQLILAGLTYRQIGQRLFISAKTVEHHVARIRQRLGVSTRNELFGRLRSQLGTSPSAGPPLAG